jgi:hypothetical protein
MPSWRASSGIQENVRVGDDLAEPHAQFDLANVSAGAFKLLDDQGRELKGQDAYGTRLSAHY